MRTLKQREASKRNGALSKGPVTPEGKARSAMNAARHGLSSKVVVLSNEDRHGWDRLLESCIGQWQPATDGELTLVHDIAGARWRLHRLLAMEAATIDHEIDAQRQDVNSRYRKIDEPTRCALAFNALTGHDRSILVYGRYESRLRRIIERAANELRRRQSERKEFCQTNLTPE